MQDAIKSLKFHFYHINDVGHGNQGLGEFMTAMHLSFPGLF